MSRKLPEQGATASDRSGRELAGNTTNSASPDAAQDSFQTNVFTWTGPGVESIFIDLGPTNQRTRRAMWKAGDLNNPGQASERSDSNG
jgi:hypothetical protein